MFTRPNDVPLGITPPRAGEDPSRVRIRGVRQQPYFSGEPGPLQFAPGEEVPQPSRLTRPIGARFTSDALTRAKPAAPPRPADPEADTKDAADDA